MLTWEFDRDEHRDLRLAAQERGMSINDALLEGLFRALAEWNQVFQPRVGGGDLCINMPIDLRREDGPRFLAANFVSYAMIRRSLAEVLESRDLSTGLTVELLQLKRDRFSSPLMRLLVDSAWGSEAELALLRHEGCLATAVFSNTGDPTRRFAAKFPRAEAGLVVGDLLLTDVAGAPPIRPLTRIAVGMVTYMRTLRICLRADASVMSASASSLFLRHFAETFSKGNSRVLDPWRAPAAGERAPGLDFAASAAGA